MSVLKKTTQSRRDKHGFTLIEIMITVAIIGILASVSATNYFESIRKARIARSIAELQSIALILDSYGSDGDFPASLDGIADTMRDPWGNPYQYLKIEGGLPKGLATTESDGLPHVSGKGDGGGSDKGSGSIMGSVRKDRFLSPINSDYDLYSVGKDGKSKPSLQTKDSKDDIVRAANGSFFGLATNF